MKKLIIGLGNPGEKYINTRHNIGFRVVGSFVHNGQFSPLQENRKHKCLISNNPDIIIAQPQMFMNNSGIAVSWLIQYFKIQHEDIIIIHDDLDIPFGDLRIHNNKSAAGHNGVNSIIHYLGTENFWRFRIGIAGKTKGTIPSDTYVLSKFAKEEEEQLNSLINESIEALKLCLTVSPEAAAQEYNQKSIKEV